MNVLVVLNPSSRDFAAKARWAEMQVHLTPDRDSAPGSLDPQFELTLVETRPDDGETRRAIAARLESADRVIAIGGDGTVHLVVDTIMNHRPDDPPELAIIPFGTANNVAKSLRLPIDNLAELAALATGESLAPMDVGHVTAVGGAGQATHWVDSITVGMDADILVARERHRKLGGWLGYAAGMAERTLEQRKLDLQVTIDGKTIDERVFNAVVNNVPFYAGELELPGASLSDGMFDVYLFNRREYASKLASFVIKQLDVLDVGVHELLEELTDNQRTHHGRIIELRWASARAIQVDGEIFGEAVGLRVRPAGRLMVVAAS